MAYFRTEKASAYEMTAKAGWLMLKKKCLRPGVAGMVGLAGQNTNNCEIRSVKSYTTGELPPLSALLARGGDWETCKEREALVQASASGLIRWRSG